jgi:hypothetical protein
MSRQAASRLALRLLTKDHPITNEARIAQENQFPAVTLGDDAARIRAKLYNQANGLDTRPSAAVIEAVS